MIPILVIVYLVGYLPAARILFVEFDKESTSNPEVSTANSKGWATFLALLWPLLLACTGLYWLLSRAWRVFDKAVFRETPRQRAVREIAERAAVEEAAQKLGLPTEDDPARGLEFGAFQVQVPCRPRCTACAKERRSGHDWGD